LSDEERGPVSNSKTTNADGENEDEKSNPKRTECSQLQAAVADETSRDSEIGKDNDSKEEEDQRLKRESHEPDKKICDGKEEHMLHECDRNLNSDLN
jgi:hypothetical protein